MRCTLALPLLIACADPADDDTPAPSFTVAIIPDTQVYAERHPEVLDRHMRWLAENADDLNLAFVSHVGDIVNVATSDGQWDAAHEAYRWLREAGIPHGLAAGNHDLLPGCDDDLACGHAAYLDHFGPSHFDGKSWYRGASPSGASNYQIVEALGLELLFLHLPLDTTTVEAEWAVDVLQAHPHALAQVTTHKFLFDYRLTEVLPEPLSRFPAGRFGLLAQLLDDLPRYNTSLTADELFETVIAPHPNVWSIHCGHVDAEFKQEGLNDRGLPVHEVLVDFQSMASGGDGLLRLLEFTPSENTVEGFTVSTETGEYRENGDGFEHSLDLLGRYSDRGMRELESLGFDTEVMLLTLEALMDDTPEREAYRASLYDAGQRDSTFVLDVPFESYTK